MVTYLPVLPVLFATDHTSETQLVPGSAHEVMDWEVHHCGRGG